MSINKLMTHEKDNKGFTNDHKEIYLYKLLCKLKQKQQ